MKRIGVLGGGQLGMLLAESVYRHGGTVSIYDPDPLAPASKQVSDGHCFPNKWTDIAALSKFFAESDAVTYEFENVDSTELYQFEKTTPVHPSVQVLYTTQDRVREKTFLRENKLPHAFFEPVHRLEDLCAQAKAFGFPCILKSTRGGYDGKGQFFLSNESDLASLLKTLELASNDYQGELEEALSIEMEVSCIVARSPEGQEVAFPICENMHKNHILDFTIFPARISETVAAKVQEIALNAARKLDAYGLLTTEFFLTKSKARHSGGTECDGWQIYINEFAPRPHNSGHVTRTAATLSQFDALARVLLGIPLTQPRIIAQGAYCMGNLLGDVWIAQGSKIDLDLSALENHPAIVDFVLYGKQEAREGRKMGHFVTHAESAEAALHAAQKFRAELAKRT